MMEKKKLIALFFVFIIIISSVYLFAVSTGEGDYREISIHDVLSYTSTRNEISDVVVVSDADPMLALVATPAACWYDIGGGSNGSSGLKPMLVTNDGELIENQDRFVRNTDMSSALVLGDVDSGQLSADDMITGRAGQISRDAAQRVYGHVAGALIVWHLTS